MKSYNVHHRVKGKHVFEAEPSVQVMAESPEDAEAQAKQMLKNHPILNEHYTGDVKAVHPGDE